MRTWLIYVIALSTATSVCAQAPTQPEVLVLNSTAVFVLWSWNGIDVAPKDAVFEISVTDAGKVVQNVSVAMKQFLVLDKLEPEKPYEIRAAFVNADHTRSLSDSETITLPKEAPKTPTSVKITSGDRSDPLSVPYTITWEFDGGEDLTGFEVLYCSTVSCDADQAESEKKSSKNLEYYTDMTVTVLAVLKDAAYKIASAPSTFRTVAGQPGPVNNLNLEQKPDTLDVNVHWSPPNQPNGEIVAYKVEVKAGETNVVSVNISDPNLSEYTYTVGSTEDASKPHNIKVCAINNGDDAVNIGAAEERPFEIRKPDPPAAVNLASRTADSLEILIERESDAELTFRILYNITGKKEVKDRSVVLSGLEPFKDVPVDVFACLRLGNDLFCSKPIENLFKTNVGVPSQVRNLTLKGPEKNDTSSTTIMLNWIEPETPAGPIDGYIVKIMDKTGVVDEEDVEAVLEYSYSLKELKNCTQYDFAVLAYNLDLISEAKINGTLGALLHHCEL